jgi:hypothetical protein
LKDEMTNNDAPTTPVEPTPTPTTPAKKKGASKIITPILALVAALVIGLFGGVLIGHSTASANTSARIGVMRVPEPVERQAARLAALRVAREPAHADSAAAASRLARSSPSAATPSPSRKPTAQASR